MQQVSLEFFDHRIILESDPLLLRKDWADWRRWPSLGATEHCHYLLWNVLFSFLLLCVLIVLPPRHWYNGILGDPIFGNFALFSPQSDPNIRLVCYCMWRTTSFLNQVLQGKTNDREEFFQRIIQLFFVFSYNSSFPFTSHTGSLNIDIKMILPLKSAGSHCKSPIIAVSPASGFPQASLVWETGL